MWMEWILLAAVTAHGCLVVFAVDPQDEVERKEQRLSVIANHLGFSWTGEPHLTMIYLTSLKYFTFKWQSRNSWIFFLKAFFSWFRVSKSIGLQRREDQLDKDRKP